MAREYRSHGTRLQCRKCSLVQHALRARFEDRPWYKLVTGTIRRPTANFGATRFKLVKLAVGWFLPTWVEC
jgi:hypothetical protein